MFSLDNNKTDMTLYMIHFIYALSVDNGISICVAARINGNQVLEPFTTFCNNNFSSLCLQQDFIKEEEEIPQDAYIINSGNQKTTLPPTSIAYWRKQINVIFHLSYKQKVYVSLVKNNTNATILHNNQYYIESSKEYISYLKHKVNIEKRRKQCYPPSVSLLNTIVIYHLCTGFQNSIEIHFSNV